VERRLASLSTATELDVEDVIDMRRATSGSGLTVVDGRAFLVIMPTIDMRRESVGTIGSTSEAAMERR